MTGAITASKKVSQFPPDDDVGVSCLSPAFLRPNHQGRNLQQHDTLAFATQLVAILGTLSTHGRNRRLNTPVVDAFHRHFETSQLGSCINIFICTYVHKQRMVCAERSGCGLAAKRGFRRGRRTRWLQELRFTLFFFPDMTEG